MPNYKQTITTILFPLRVLDMTFIYPYSGSGIDGFDLKSLVFSIASKLSANQGVQ